MSAPWPTGPATADPLTAGQWRVAATFEQALLAAPEAAALRRMLANELAAAHQAADPGNGANAP